MVMIYLLIQIQFSRQISSCSSGWKRNLGGGGMGLSIKERKVMHARNKEEEALRIICNGEQKVQVKNLDVILDRDGSIGKDVSFEVR